MRYAGGHDRRGLKRQNNQGACMKTIRPLGVGRTQAAPAAANQAPSQAFQHRSVSSFDRPQWVTKEAPADRTAGGWNMDAKREGNGNERIVQVLAAWYCVLGVCSVGEGGLLHRQGMSQSRRGVGTKPAPTLCARPDWGGFDRVTRNGRNAGNQFKTMHLHQGNLALPSSFLTASNGETLHPFRPAGTRWNSVSGKVNRRCDFEKEKSVRV
jgi:hypothetical protein